MMTLMGKAKQNILQRIIKPTFRMFIVLPCDLPTSKLRLGFVPRFSEIAIVKELTVKLCEQDSCTTKRPDYGRLQTKNSLLNLLT